MLSSIYGYTGVPRVSLGLVNGPTNTCFNGFVYLNLIRVRVRISINGYTDVPRVSLGLVSGPTNTCFHGFVYLTLI